MNKVEYETEGVIFNIQRYSLHDGPGIRTIPFFKGCSLSCKWCSNPESQRPQPELIFKKSDCIRCGKCIEVCPQQALSTTNAWFIDRDRCIQCGKCTDVCPTHALEMKGKRMSVTAVMRELEKEENLPAFRRRYYPVRRRAAGATGVRPGTAESLQGQGLAHGNRNHRVYHQSGD